MHIVHASGAFVSTAGMLEATLLPVAPEPHASPCASVVSEVELLTMIRRGISGGCGSEKVAFLRAIAITAKLSNS